MYEMPKLGISEHEIVKISPIAWVAQLLTNITESFLNCLKNRQFLFRKF